MVSTSVSSLPEDVLNDSTKSAQEEIADNDVIHDQMTEYLLITTYMVLMIIGLLANGIIMKIIIFTQQLRQNPNNVLVLNLTISGLLMSIFCIPFTMISVIRYSWKFGLILCKLITSVQSCSILVCSTTIAVISIDRYFRVTNRHPVNFNDPRQARKHWITLIIETTIIWTISIVATIPFTLYQKIGTRKDGSTSCTEEWPSSWFKSSTLIIYFLVQFVLPFIILMVSSFKIRTYLERTRRSSASSNNQRQQEHIPLETFVHSRRTSTVEVNIEVSCLAPEMTSSNTNHVIAQEKSALKLNREIARNQQVTRTLTNITLSFVFLWLPWNIFNTYIDNFTVNWSMPQMYLAFTFTHIIAMISVPLNAFLYGWNNPMIKVQILAMFGKPPAN